MASNVDKQVAGSLNIAAIQKHLMKALEACSRMEECCPSSENCNTQKKGELRLNDFKQLVDAIKTVQPLAMGETIVEARSDRNTMLPDKIEALRACVETIQAFEDLKTPTASLMKAELEKEAASILASFRSELHMTNLLENLQL